MSKNSPMPLGYKLFFGAVVVYLTWQMFRPKTAKPKATGSEGEAQRTASEEQTPQDQSNGGGYSGGGYGVSSYGSSSQGTQSSSVVQMTPNVSPQAVVYEDPVIIPSTPRTANPFASQPRVSFSLPKIKTTTTSSTPRTSGEEVQTVTTAPPRTNPYQSEPRITTVKRPVLSSFAKNIILKAPTNQTLGS